MRLKALTSICEFLSESDFAFDLGRLQSPYLAVLRFEFVSFHGFFFVCGCCLIISQHYPFVFVWVLLIFSSLDMEFSKFNLGVLVDFLSFLLF